MIDKRKGTQYDILPPEQKLILPELAATKELGLVLYGGTAIALQIGHRESVDFDFFTDQDLDREALRKAIPKLELAEVIQDEPNSWSLLARNDDDGRPVKLSFFGGLSFGRVGEPALTDNRELALASLDDLLGHKLKVLLQRVELKDYIDIAALLRNGADLERGLGAARTLFGPTFPPAEALRALTYFKEGNVTALGEDDRAFLRAAVSKVSSAQRVERVSIRLTSDEILQSRRYDRISAERQLAHLAKLSQSERIVLFFIVNSTDIGIISQFDKVGSAVFRKALNEITELARDGNKHVQAIASEIVSHDAPWPTEVARQAAKNLKGHGGGPERVATIIMETTAEVERGRSLEP